MHLAIKDNCVVGEAVQTPRINFKKKSLQHESLRKKLDSDCRVYFEWIIEHFPSKQIHSLLLEYTSEAYI